MSFSDKSLACPGHGGLRAGGSGSLASDGGLGTGGAWSLLGARAEEAPRAASSMGGPNSHSTCKGTWSVAEANLGGGAR